MAEIVDRTWVPKPSSYSLFSREYAHGELYEGYIVTPHGVVGVYQGFKYLLLDIVVDGVQHRRRIKATYSERYVVTLARRFAEEKGGA